MNVQANISPNLSLSDILANQRTAFISAGAPSLRQRLDSLSKLKAAILALRTEYEEAISADFGNRSRFETAVMEIMPVTQGIDYLRKHLGRWMRPQSRHVALQFRPARAKVVMQPLGVVGIVSPWNYPLALCLMPLATALAAGNRVMIKPSEYTPRTSALMASMLSGIFSGDEVAVVTGGPEVGAAFSALPFDHLFFTGVLHRQYQRGQGHHARRQREPGAGHARTGRQVASRRRRGLPDRPCRQGARLWQAQQCRPDLRRA
jgi:coniferyl-aldehyde dehydrogenase